MLYFRASWHIHWFLGHALPSFASTHNTPDVVYTHTQYKQQVLYFLFVIALFEVFLFAFFMHVHFILSAHNSGHLLFTKTLPLNTTIVKHSVRTLRSTRKHKLSLCHSRVSFCTAAFFVVVAVVRFIVLHPVSSAFFSRISHYSAWNGVGGYVRESLRVCSYYYFKMYSGWMFCSIFLLCFRCFNAKF